MSVAYLEGSIQEGTTTRIVYDPSGGPLASSSPVYVLYGFNGWQTVAMVSMTLSEGLWHYDVTIPSGSAQIDLFFQDDTTYDPTNWHITLEANQNNTLPSSTRIAFVGDTDPNANGIAIANAIHDLNPDYVVTLGDNLYSPVTSYDVAMGQLFARYMYPYSGAYGPGATDGNRFFPIPGNHDYSDPPGGISDYLAYMPVEALYYHFSISPYIQLFMVDSENADGIAEGSAQYEFFSSAIQGSSARWKIVCVHRPPYTTGTSHLPTLDMRWPFNDWGVYMVLAGHNHQYERFLLDEVYYVVNGGGGKSLYGFSTPNTSSDVRYNADYSAVYIDFSAYTLRLRAINTDGTVVDELVIDKTPSSNDLGKVQSLSVFLRQTLLPAVTAAFNQPGVTFLGNRHKNQISLDASLRLAIGPPIPSSLMAQGIMGLYQLPNTPTTTRMYDLQLAMARNKTWTPEVEKRRLSDPNEPKNIRIVTNQTWHIDRL